MKIVDGGYVEAVMAFENGADIVTVLGFASFKTISEVRRAADEFGGETCSIRSRSPISNHLRRRYLLCRLTMSMSTLRRDLSGGGEHASARICEKDRNYKESPLETKTPLWVGFLSDNLSYVFPLKLNVVIAGRSIWEGKLRTLQE